MRKASIKETGEELSQEEWARFDKAVAELRAERRNVDFVEFPFSDRERGVDMQERLGRF